MNSKYNNFIFVLLFLFGAFTALICFHAGEENILIYITTIVFLYGFSISDIKVKTISAIWGYMAMIFIFMLRFYFMCGFAVEYVPKFMIESIIVFVIFNIVSKALKGRIGNGDFDVAYIIYLSIGLTGMFCSFVIGCLLSLMFSLHIILKKHKNLKSYSVPFIPYLYMGYLIVLLLAKGLIFI